MKLKHDIDEEERKQLYEETKYYRVKFRNDENEIDRLKEEIRKLKATKKGGDFDDVNPKIRTVL